MKQMIYLLLLLGMLLIVGSCISPSEPTHHGLGQWLCCINADGTGFRKIKKSDSGLGTTGFKDIYMTKDDRIIFYGDRLWISETDTIRPVSITDNIYTLQKLPARLSQSPDGSKLYFASRDKNIHELNLNTMMSRQLTSETIRTLRNPIVSDLGNYITYTSRGYGAPSKFTEYLYWMNLKSGEFESIPTIDSICVNAYYSEIEDYVYYEGINVKRSRLDGSELSVVSLGGSMYPYSAFDLTSDQNYIIHIWDAYPIIDLKIHNKFTGNSVRFPVKYANNELYLARLCRNANIVYYVSPGYPEKLHVHDLDTGETKEVIPPKGIGEYYMIAPTWDGSKVYFRATVAY